MKNNSNIIHHIFEDSVNHSMEDAAIICENNLFTYQDINERSNQLARKLREQGVGRGCVVAILLERSAEMYISIMAALKAGGAYLPITPEYPLERIEYMLDNSKSMLILSTKNVIAKYDFKIAFIDVESPSSYHPNTANLNIPCSPSDLMYVIYTSGSTGRPKGVMIEHASAANRLHWMQKAYPIGSSDIILQKTPITFDVSVWELFWWFFNRSKLFLMKPNGEKNIEEIIETIEQYKITAIHFVPSMLNIFLDYLQFNNYPQKAASLCYVFCSGEALNPSHVEKFNRLFHQKERPLLVNLYGPTEATVDVTHYKCENLLHPKVIPIGKPIDNIRISIMDENHQPCHTGESGELCISGIGVGRGYINSPDMTREKFVADPFIEGARMYRTGDLARRMPDGNIEFLGRMDHQVKIRGYRIELGEIEYHILRHPSVKEAVVLNKVIHEDQNILVACLVFYQKTNILEMKRYLQKKLPDYMIPHSYVTLESLPYNANGKVDRNQLQNLI